MLETEELYKLVTNDTATNIINNVTLNKDTVTNALNTLLYVSLVALERVEGGREFLNKYLYFRGLDIQSGVIFTYLLSKDLLDKDTGKSILVDYFRLTSDERKNRYPKNTSGFRGTDCVISILRNKKEQYVKLFEFLLSLNDKQALELYACNIKIMFDNNFINDEHMNTLLDKYTPNEVIPCNFKYTTTWVKRATKLTREHLTVLFIPYLVPSPDKYRSSHTLIIEHPKFDPNDIEFMDEYLEILEMKFYISKESLDRLVPLLTDESLRKRIILKFYLYMLYPERYPDYDCKNKLSRQTYTPFHRAVTYFCDHLPETRVEQQRYDWFVSVVISRILDTRELHCNKGMWEILEKLVPKYRTILKLRDLISKLTQGHACRECGERLDKLYKTTESIQI